jgi:hypothetical protein
MDKLAPEDVSVGTSGSASATRGNFARATQLRSYGMRMRHLPTGITVEIESGSLMLTKKQWKLKKQEMHDKLWARLGQQVARHCRVDN